MIAPSDNAFLAAIKKLNLTAAEVLADTKLIKTLISLHLASVPSLTSTTGTTLSGDVIEFFVHRNVANLKYFIKSKLTKSKTVGLVGGAEAPKANPVIQCPGGGAVAAFTSSVLLPPATPTTATAPAAASVPAATSVPTTAGGPAPAATSKPTTTGGPTPAPAAPARGPTAALAPAASSAGAATFGLAAAVVMAVAVFA